MHNRHFLEKVCLFMNVECFVVHLFVNIHVYVPTVLVCTSTSCIPGTRLSAHQWATGPISGIRYSCVQIDYYRIVVSAQHAVVVFSFNVGNDVGTD